MHDDQVDTSPPSLARPCRKKERAALPLRAQVRSLACLASGPALLTSPRGKGERQHGTCHATADQDTCRCSRAWVRLQDSIDLRTRGDDDDDASSCRSSLTTASRLSDIPGFGTRNIQHATYCMQHAARNIQHAACNTQHAARAGYHVKIQRCSKLSLPRGDCVQQVYVVCCMTDVCCSHLQRHGNSAQGRSYACQTKISDWMGWMRATTTHRRAGGLTPATSAPGPGSPLPHLHRDRAHPCHICTGNG
jgi:hypothetical protein